MRHSAASTRAIAIAVAFAAQCSATAQACSPLPREQLTPSEAAAKAQLLDHEFVAAAKAAEGILDIQVVSSSDYDNPSAQIRISRVLRGKFRPGQILTLRTVSSVACGAGELGKGQRGVIILSANKLRRFDGFVTKDRLDRLRGAGVIRR
jgi:hypothetical protein